jgi:PAS domain S-box-containing protein
VQKTTSGRTEEAGKIDTIYQAALGDEAFKRALTIGGMVYVVLDRDLRIRDANEALCDLLEQPLDELLGANWVARCVPSELQERTRSHLAGCFAGTSPQPREHDADLQAAGGERFTIRWHHARIDNPESTSVVLVSLGTNITEARRIASVLAHNPNPVLSLSREGDVLLANDAAQTMLELIAREGDAAVQSWRELVRSAVTENFAGDLHFDGKTYYFMSSKSMAGTQTDLYGMDVTDQEALNSRLEAIAGNLPGALFDYRLAPDGSDRIDYMSPGCESLWEIDAKRMGSNPSLLWSMILEEDLPAMSDSVAQSASNLSHWQHEWRIRTPSGKLKWLRGMANPTRDQDGATCWTTIVTDITENKTAEESVAQALRKTINVLSAAVEARDPYTAGHEQRVASIARKIGQELGLSSRRLTGLELAGLVHDVGKIQVPAEILSKPGRLTELELALVKQHPVVGARLLDGIDFEWPIQAIIRQHHERLDGSGYPDGLKGDDILLEARIIAVADTLEAMASHRPYRPAQGIEDAAAEIRDGAGTRYDTEVAAACLKLIDEQRLSLT